MLEKGGIKIIYNSSNSGLENFLCLSLVLVFIIFSLAFTRVFVYKILFILFYSLFYFSSKKNVERLFSFGNVCAKNEYINTHTIDDGKQLRSRRRERRKMRKMLMLLFLMSVCAVCHTYTKQNS